MTEEITKGKVVVTLIGAATGFYFVNRGSEFIQTQFVIGEHSSNTLENFPGWLTGSLLHISNDRFDLILGGVAATLILLIVLYNSGGTNTRRGEEQGSAAWAKPGDIKPFTTKNPATRLQLTATEALALDTHKTQRNLNVTVIGVSGSGKTRSYVLPNLSTIEGMSFACTDPKGEIFQRIAGVLEAKGMKVRQFNLVDLHKSGHFNPLMYFSDDDPETSVAQLTECIIANTTGKESHGDGFWERAERALLTALIAYAWATKTDMAGGPSLPDVVDLHKEMEGNESNPDEFTSETDLKMEAARDVVKEWHKNPEAFDATVMKMLNFATRQYRVYQQGPAETRLSIIISLGVRLAPLDMYDVREILGSDDLALDRIGVEPTALFLCIPDTHQTFKFLAAMFWQSLFEKNIYLADHEEGGELPVPLHCFLDEFANIGKIPGFPIVMSTIRSRGISASVIVQSYKQGQALWRDDWPTIVANCDSILYLGGRDLDTLKWLSALIGEETVTTEDVSRTYGTTGSWTRAQRTVKRALMTPDEIGVMPNDLAILLVRGLRPFKSPKVRAA